jgi:hypothetical protein
MAYESQMIALARGAVALHGELKEVLFLSKNKDSMLVFSDGTTLPVEHRRYGYDINRESYALRLAGELGGTDPFSLLAFGYNGTGPACYAAFLNAAGFKGANVVDIAPPLKLRGDGSTVNGTRRQAKVATEISERSMDEARKKIEEPRFGDSCILFEEVLCDGAIATKVVRVDTASPEEAEKTAKRQIPPSSEVLDLNVLDKQTTNVETIEAYDETEASENARGRIKSSESSYKSLTGIACVVKVRKGLLGIGKKAGAWEAKYTLAHKEVTIRYRPLAAIRIHYGSKKLKCGQCGNVMTATTEGVHDTGARPSADSAILKLRCEKCDITRFEKRWEIEGEWIAWDDGSKTVL